MPDANRRHRPIPECGTTAGYQRHRRHHEPIDDACRAANNAARWRNKQQLAQRRKLEDAARRLAAEAVELGHPAAYEALYAQALREEMATGGAR